jgi:hypothetical protein
MHRISVRHRVRDHSSQVGTFGRDNSAPTNITLAAR